MGSSAIRISWGRSNSNRTPGTSAAYSFPSVPANPYSAGENLRALQRLRVFLPQPGRELPECSEGVPARCGLRHACRHAQCSLGAQASAQQGLVHHPVSCTCNSADQQLF